MPNKTITKKATKTQSEYIENVKILIYCFIIQTSIFVASSIVSFVADIKSERFYLVSVLAFSIGGAFSGFIAVRKTKKNGLVNGILYTLPTGILYILISSVLNSFEVEYLTLLSFALLLICSAAGGILSVNFSPKVKLKSKR